MLHAPRELGRVRQHQIKRRGGDARLDIGVAYYPVFLLPLWLSFYWQRGLLRFSIGVASMIVVLVGTLAFYATDWDMFLAYVGPNRYCQTATDLRAPPSAAAASRTSVAV